MAELVNEMIVPLPAHGVRMLSIGQLIEPGTCRRPAGTYDRLCAHQSMMVEGDGAIARSGGDDLPPGHRRRADALDLR